MRINYKRILLILSILFISGCSLTPSVNIVLIDRHTVMESEAAGDWPQMENNLHLNKGPIPLADVNESQRENRALQVLNGEFSTKSLTHEK